MIHNSQSTEASISLKRRPLFYGWWIVISGAILRFFSGGAFYYGFSVFFNPIREAFGWNAATTSVAFTLRSIETGAFSPIVGILADKISPRKLMIIGWSIIGGGFLLMSRIDSLWTFYGTFVLIAIGMSLGTGLVMNTTVANWFTRKRSRALAITFIGPGACGILAPLMALSVSTLGWRQTLVVMGITLWVIGIPLSLLFRDRPSHYGYLPDGDLPDAQSTSAKAVSRPLTGFSAKAAIKTRAFWMISLTQLFQQMGTSAVAVHIVPYLESVGVSTTIAALAVTGLTVCSLIGRLGFGFWGDYTNKRKLIAFSIAIQAAGLLSFSLIDQNNVWFLGVFLLTYGPGFGGPIPLWPALQADFFGTKSYGTIMGLLTLTSVIGGLSSPVIAGLIYDATGSYQLAWYLCLLVTIPAIPLILLARPPKPTA
jgi:MFS family permease